jgi:integrase
MPRPAKPWYRASADAWYVTHGGRQVMLARGKAARAEAVRAFHELKAKEPERGRPSPAEVPTCGRVFGLFLDHVQALLARGDVQPVTASGYLVALTSADAHFGRVEAARVRPHHVEAWLDAHPPGGVDASGRKLGWGPTTRFNKVTAVKRAFRWARRMGHLEADPLEGMERPRPKRRDVAPTPGAVKALIVARPDDAWRDLMTVMDETGARPGEVCRVTAAMVDLGARVWRVPNKTARKTGRGVRVIYLSDAALEVSRRLVAARPTGPLFLNARGRPWTRNAMACRFRRLRAKLGMGREATAYGVRHTWITDALEAEVPIATVAELAGHAGTKMVESVYSKLKDRSAYLGEAARKVRPSPTSAGSGGTSPSGPESGGDG